MSAGIVISMFLLPTSTDWHQMPFALYFGDSDYGSFKCNICDKCVKCHVTEIQLVTSFMQLPLKLHGCPNYMDVLNVRTAAAAKYIQSRTSIIKYIQSRTSIIKDLWHMESICANGAYNSLIYQSREGSQLRNASKSHFADNPMLLFMENAGQWSPKKIHPWTLRDLKASTGIRHVIFCKSKTDCMIIYDMFKMEFWMKVFSIWFRCGTQNHLKVPLTSLEQTSRIQMVSSVY